MKRVLGIDFGRVRIGVAISDELGLLAHPLETIPSGRVALSRIAAIVREKDVDCVVVGVPKTMSGQLGPAAEEAKAFRDKLAGQIDCKIIPWDERLTTVAAHRALQDAGKKAKETRGYVDQVAAQMILQGYLDRQQILNAPIEPAE